MWQQKSGVSYVRSLARLGIIGNTKIYSHIVT